MALSTYVVVGNALRGELEAKGLAASQYLAESLLNPLLDEEFLLVQRSLEDAKASLPDVEYAYVIGFDGRLVAHTFPNGFPAALIYANIIPMEQTTQVQVLLTERGIIRDIGFRVLSGLPAELHIGLNEARINASLKHTTGLILGLTLLATILGGTAAGILGEHLTRPLGDLARSALRLGQGHLDEKIPIRSKDEIGQLAADFNMMAANLQATIGELRQRNQELLALNAIANALSGPMELTVVLERALKATLEATGFAAGWILLFDESGKHHPPVCWHGLPEDTVLQESMESRPCLCHRAIQEQKPMVIELESSCPALGVPIGQGKRIMCHATVPLLAKGHALGVLNIAGHETTAFTAEILQLLGAIGGQLSIAIENARLWEELRRKEELRGQLLHKVIIAQEEERKRIGRELHDETSQALAALVVVLQAARAAISMDLKRCAEYIDEAKAAVTRTIQDLHAIIYDLRPSLLDDLGLLPALRWCAQNRLERRGIEVIWDVEGEEIRLPSEVETALFRIGQEAMTNIAKYAHADQVRIRVEFKPAYVTLQVSDDGVGFNVAQVMSQMANRNVNLSAPSDAAQEKVGAGLGLLGMEERASLLGGQFQIESTPGRGTTVTARIPIN